MDEAYRGTARAVASQCPACSRQVASIAYGSSVVTRATTGNRIHAFRDRQDAQRHAASALGRVLTGTERPRYRAGPGRFRPASNFTARPPKSLTRYLP